MTLITDAKKLLDECQETEAEIYNAVSIHLSYAERTSFRYDCSRALELQNKCRQMADRFDNAVALTKKAALRSHLRRMAFRLEAAVMFVKNRLKLDE